MTLGLPLDRACPSARRSGVPRPERGGFHSVRDARADTGRPPPGDGGRASLIRAAFSALACLTRYMGASVILAVVPLLLAPREKMKRIAIYTLITAAPVGLWMLWWVCGRQRGVALSSQSHRCPVPIAMVGIWNARIQRGWPRRAASDTATASADRANREFERSPLPPTNSRPWTGT